jgi:ParB family chromosome partitioning protein
MSLQKKGADLLAAVGKSLDMSSAGPLPRHPSVPGTAIGMMVNEANGGLRDRLAKAEAEVKTLKEGDRVFKVDPARVRRSPYADRHELAFQDTDVEFEKLCELIKDTAGNTEPAQLRPMKDDPSYDYEVASGHRRHAACLKLHLPLTAIVREMTDAELVRQMSIENSGRTNLSAYERGCNFKLLLAKNVFTSGRDLAARLALSQTTVVSLLKFAELPRPIIDAFTDPREIRAEWLNPLLTAWKDDRERFLVTLATLERGLRPAETYRRLAGLMPKKGIIASSQEVLGSIRMIHNRPAIVLFKDAPPELIAELQEVIKRWAANKESPK